MRTSKDDIVFKQCNKTVSMLLSLSPQDIKASHTYFTKMPKFLGKTPKTAKVFRHRFLSCRHFSLEKSHLSWSSKILKQSLCCSPSIHTSVKSSPKITKMPKCLGKEIHPNHIKSVFTETENNLIK